MAVSLETFKEYVNAPPDISDTVLQMYLDAAKEKAKIAGVPEFQDNALYDLFLMELGGCYYDNRGMAFSGAYQATAEETASKICNSFVLELRHAEDGVAK